MSDIKWNVVRVLGDRRYKVAESLSKHDADLVRDIWERQFLMRGQVLVEQDVEVEP